MDQTPGVRTGQVAFQVLLLLGSCVLFWEAYKIEGIGSISGSGIFPLLAALALVLSLAVRIVADIGQARRQTMETDGTSKSGFIADVLPLPILGFMLVCILYAVGMSYWGFWIPTGVFLFVTLIWLYTRNLFKVASIVGGSLGFIYFVFAYIFKVYLP